MHLFRVLVVALFANASALATTVIPPSFDELVGDAELIFRGRVTTVESGWTGGGTKPRIATRVTFAVERSLRGEAGETMTLEFIGGTVGTRTFTPAGWPQFAVGERGVFFVENRTGRICPLVRLRHGRYRVVDNGPSGEERIVRDDYTPLTAVAGVAAPLTGENGTRARPMSAAPGLTLAAFEAQILSRSMMLPRPEAKQR